MVWRLQVQDQGCQQSSFLLMPLFACRQLTSLCPHTVFSLHAAGVSLYVQISSCRDTSHIGLGSTLTASFYLNHHFKGPISKCSHSPRSRGLGCQHRQSTALPPGLCSSLCSACLSHGGLFSRPVLHLALLPTLCISLWVLCALCPSTSGSAFCPYDLFVPRRAVGRGSEQGSLCSGFLILLTWHTAMCN